MPPSRTTRARLRQRSRRSGNHRGGVTQRGDRRAVAVDRAHVVVAFAATDAARRATAAQVFVHERADVLVPAVGRTPELVELLEDAARHTEGAPHPVRRWPGGFD